MELFPRQKVLLRSRQERQNNSLFESFEKNIKNKTHRTVSPSDLPNNGHLFVDTLYIHSLIAE